MIIETKYIRESIRIINTYDSLIKELKPFEDAIVKNRDIILNLQKQIENLKDKFMPDELKKTELNDIMISYEKEITKLEEITLPYINKLEKLKKDSASLYTIFKKLYPNISDEELKLELHKQMQEYNLNK